MPYKLNIPQNLVEFKDGGLALRTNHETVRTKSVLILGKSVDGPVDEPVATSYDTSALVFGKDVDSNGIPNGGTIDTAVNDLYRAGCRDIRAMKISGANAKAKVQGPVKSESTIEKKEISIGVVGGNESTVLVLNNAGAIKDSISIFVNDKILPCTFEFDAASNTITIPAGVCEALKPVYVKYDYTAVIEDVNFEETLVVGAENTVTIEKTPKEGSVVVLVNDIIVPASAYTVTAKVIDFSPAAKRKSVTVGIGDIVTVEYLAQDTVVRGTTDNAKDAVPYMTVTAIQVLTLDEEPKKGSVVLYCNDKEVHKKFYAVAGSTISIKKEQLSFGGEIIASFLISTNKDNTAVIDFESFFASSLYNSGSIEIAEIVNSDDVAIGKEIIITKPREKQAIGEKPLGYSSLVYPTFGSLVNAINSDIRGGVYKASTDFGDELCSSLDIVRVNFSGGDSGVNATLQEIKEALSGKRDENGYLVEDGVYQLLEGYNVDYIILTGVYADDILSVREGFAYDLALHCAFASHKNKTIYGAIALSPCKNTSLKGIKEYVGKLARWNVDGREFLLKEDGKVVDGPEGKTTDLGMYVRVVGGTEPLYLNDNLGKHPANPAVAYIGLQSVLNAQSSPLNKALQNSKGLRFRLNESQLKALTSANVITFTQKQNNRGDIREEAYVYDSMTQALPDSDYVRTTACEVVRLIADDIREIADPYIGEPPTVESKNSFAASLSKRFSQRRQEGSITDISFEILETPQMMLIGDCNVDTTIVTPGERRRIRTTIGLKPML